jgi:hypothetical protein
VPVARRAARAQLARDGHAAGLDHRLGLSVVGPILADTAGSLAWVAMAALCGRATCSGR